MYAIIQYVPLPEDKQLIAVPMSRALAGALRDLAIREETSMAALIRQLIRQALNEKKSPDVASAGAKSDLRAARYSFKENRTTG
jgi:hypothetical protein